MKRLLLLLMLVLLILCSCELMVEEPPKPGKVHILVYGNDYSSLASVNTLNGTVNDAVQVGRALAGLCKTARMEYDATFIFGDCSGVEVPYPISHYEDLILGDGIDATISHDVTYSRLFNALADLISTAAKDDITFIYFSGHGANASEQRVEYGEDVTDYCYLVTKDALDLSKHTLVPVSILQTGISEIPGTKVVLSDFCFSGSLVSPSYVSATGLEYRTISLGELFSMRDKINIDPSLFCLSACYYYETSVEHGLHGDFTKALLNAFGWDETFGRITNGGARKNDRLTFFDVAEYAQENGKYSYDQHPIYSGGSNDIVLFSF